MYLKVLFQCTNIDIWSANKYFVGHMNLKCHLLVISIFTWVSGSNKIGKVTNLYLELILEKKLAVTWVDSIKTICCLLKFLNILRSDLVVIELYLVQFYLQYFNPCY